VKTATREKEKLSDTAKRKGVKKDFDVKVSKQKGEPASRQIKKGTVSNDRVYIEKICGGPTPEKRCVID